MNRILAIRHLIGGSMILRCCMLVPFVAGGLMCPEGYLTVLRVP